MSDKTLLTTAFSVQSVRLVTCLICLLLTFPLVETFVYDKADRMLSTADGNGNVRAFGYDEVGNRIRTSV